MTERTFHATFSRLNFLQRSKEFEIFGGKKARVCFSFQTETRWIFFDQVTTSQKLSTISPLSSSTVTLLAVVSLSLSVSRLSRLTDWVARTYQRLASDILTKGGSVCIRRVCGFPGKRRLFTAAQRGKLKRARSNGIFAGDARAAGFKFFIRGSLTFSGDPALQEAPFDEIQGSLCLTFPRIVANDVTSEMRVLFREGSTLPSRGRRKRKETTFRERKRENRSEKRSRICSNTSVKTMNSPFG